jgi:hypothetical protein
MDDVKTIGEQNLLTIQGKTWTVDHFREEIKRHPLVFRKAELNKNNFTEHFKYAIVDLIRDKYITQAAYSKGYDRQESVVRSTQMWKDHMLAVYQKSRYLDSIKCTETDFLKIVKDYMSDYVDSLQKKYSHITEINMDDFEKIELLRTDMLVNSTGTAICIKYPGIPVTYREPFN